MGKRDVASFVVIALFGASLAATSKPRHDGDEDDSGRSRFFPYHDAGDAQAGEGGKTTELAPDAAAPRAQLAAPVKNAELPDTTAWKPFTHAATRLSGKTPPGADVTCAKVSELAVCSVVRHAKMLAQFTSVSIGADLMIDIMKHDTSAPSMTLYEDDASFAVMRNDPKQGSWCEMVASSPAGLKAVVTAPVGDAGIQAVTLNRTECLEMLAFARTLVHTP